MAKPGDERRVFDLLSQAHAENAVAPISEGRVLDQIEKATHQRGGLIGMIEGPTRLEACLVMALGQFWYSDAFHLEELVNYVHPDHRRSKHAHDLIDFGKWAAETMSLPLFMGVLSGSRTKAKIRLYRRQIRMGGAMFFHNPTYGTLTEFEHDNAV